jgi:uncharacterized protein (TIGR03435 family)
MAMKRIRVGLLLIGAVTFLASSLLFLAVNSFAQSSRLTFEVASVKVNTTGRNMSTPPVTWDGDRFIATDAGLTRLLQYAYRRSDETDLRFSDIIGAPAWANTDGFDIQATAGGKGEPVSQNQMRLMVQSLLADRFQLKAHWEAREMPVYDLIVAKGGAKLKWATDEPPGKQQTIGVPSPSGAMTLKRTASAISLSELATFLQSYAGRPVKDKTGLTGFFDVALQFVLESGSATPPSGAPSPSDPSGPSIFTALQETTRPQTRKLEGAC